MGLPCVELLLASIGHTSSQMLDLPLLALVLHSRHAAGEVLDVETPLFFYVPDSTIIVTTKSKPISASQIIKQ